MNEIEKVFFPNEKQYKNMNYEQKNKEENNNFEELFDEEIKKLEPKEISDMKEDKKEELISQVEASRNIFNAKHNL